MDKQNEERPLCTYIKSLEGKTYTIVKSMGYEKMIPMYVKAGLEIDTQKIMLDDLLMCLELISSESKLVGGATVIYTEHEYVLKAIAIEKEYRGKNLGTLLVMKIIELVRALGARRLMLNAKVPEFYKKLGFEIVPRNMAPDISDCLNCHRYHNGCESEIMKMEW